MKHLYLGLGSNLGKMQENLEQALACLRQHFPDLRSSCFYRTKAYPIDPQDRDKFYLNSCTVCTTNLPVLRIIEITKGIEASFGREAERELGMDRTLDIDIVLYGDECITSPEITVPHRELTLRDFFLVPLLELEPQLTDPRSGKPLGEFLAALSADELTIIEEQEK